jgi:hypothetical protein
VKRAFSSEVEMIQSGKRFWRCLMKRALEIAQAGLS